MTYKAAEDFLVHKVLEKIPHDVKATESFKKEWHAIETTIRKSFEAGYEIGSEGLVEKDK